MFDFGGVLLRWQPAEFMPRLLPAHACEPVATRELIGAFFEGFEGDWGRFDAGHIDAAELAPKVARRTGVDRADILRTIAAVAHELQPVPEVVALVDSLKARGHRLWFLSNMPAPYATVIEAAHPIDAWFEGGLYSSRVGLRKPAAAIFDLLAERFDLDPAATLFIDDSPRNIEAARMLGWRTLQFGDPAQCRAELMHLGLF